MVLSVSWHPDGEKLITILSRSGQTSPREYAVIWDPKVERKLITLEVNKEDRSHVFAWSPDGTMLATGSEDNTAAVWDTSNVKSSQKLTDK